MQLCDKIQKSALALLIGALAISSVALLSVSILLALLVIPTLFYFAIQAFGVALGVFYRAQPMQELFSAAINRAVDPLNKLSPKPIHGFATRNGVDSHAWKLQLIRSARHNLLISGCYCGGSVFDEVLQLIQTQMRAHPALTASISTAPFYFSKANKRLIQELEAEFGPRFFCIVFPTAFPFTSPITDTFSISTNHTKALVIDYGAAYMLGGSGIVSCWAAEEGISPAGQIEKHGFFVDTILGLGAFRDTDFVFHSPELNGIGTRLYMEMHKLLERFRYRREPAPADTAWPVRLDLPPLPKPFAPMQATLYATGPEALSSPFLEEVIDKVNKAQHSIRIGHMYFFPPKRLFEALIAASNRGIQITLITNKRGEQSPGSHLTFAELGRYYTKKLYEGKEKPHVECYEFNIPHTTYHKKVIVIDDEIVFCGSSNVSKKSVQCVDYEIDLQVVSKPFARSVALLLEEDKQYCQKESNPRISLKTRVMATLQTQLVPIL
jgi:hypothetical protein